MNGTETNMKPVVNDHKAVSIGLIHFVVKSFFLYAFILKLTLMNRAPRAPPTIPMTIAAGIT